MTRSQELDKILWPLGGILDAKSKGGKVFYACPECKDFALIKTIRLGGQASYECQACHHWGPWKERLKISRKRIDSGKPF